MLSKLSHFFLAQKQYDRRYYRFRGAFMALNLERIEKFSLITAIALGLFTLLPNLMLSLFFTGEKPAITASLLFLEVSAVCSMLLFYAASQWIKEDTDITKKALLVKSFIFVALLHAILFSLQLYGKSNTIPFFLLSCCALMASLYWSARQLLLYISLGQLIFLISHYLVYQEAALFHTHLPGQLVYLAIFYYISRSILELKLRAFENAATIEAQTEQLLAKSKRLRITEHALSTLHKNSYQGVFRLEDSRGFTYVNDHFAEMMGFASATALLQQGRKFNFIPQHELEKIAKKLNQQGYAEGLEVEAMRRDGSLFWMQFNCAVRSDEITGLLVYEGSAHDISNRKKALREAQQNAARLEQVEKIALVGFYEIDISTSRFGYSAGYRSILGIAEQENICLNDHLAYVHPEDQPELRRILLEAIIRGEGYSLNYRVSDQQGGWKHLLSKGKVVQNDYGKDFKILSIVQDVTQLHRQAYTHGIEARKDLRPIRILMAEDNQINQAVAGKFLQSWGICYDIAENGLEALEMARKRHYDLILMDLQMPEMDGFEATRRIRQLGTPNYSQTPILAITEAVRPEIEEEMRQAGISDMVLKPFKLETLLDKLTHYCPDMKESANGTDKPENTNLPSLPDLSGVLAVAGGDKTFLQELVGLYIRQFTEAPLEIRAALPAQDRLQLRRIFHKLRPSIVMLKIEEMTLLGDSIHQQLHDESISFNVLQPRLEHFVAMMEALKQQLLHQAQSENIVLNL